MERVLEGAEAAVRAVRGKHVLGQVVAADAEEIGPRCESIRDQSGGSTTLKVENSYFLHNQDGILTSNPGETILVTNSIFKNNGASDGKEHALYVGAGFNLTVSGSTFCGTTTGHDIKSRANEAIAQSLKEGKGNISASALLRMAPAAQMPAK